MNLICVPEDISLRYTSILFRRTGTLTCTLFENQFGREKALDVKLAVDMITLKDIYDIAIIISGNQDYVPAC